MRQRPACRPGVVGRSDRAALSAHDDTTADRRQGPAITGRLIVDLTDLEPWANFHDEFSQARSRLYSAVVGAPTGADLVIRVGRFRPFADMWRDAGLSHLGTIIIEGDDAGLVRRWVTAVREDLG